MAHTYTPGLKVSSKELISKRRILPLKGDVLVKQGDKVKPDDVVARTLLPGPVETMNVANVLGILPDEINTYMLKKEGEEITQGEVIGRSKSFFGLFKSEVKAKLTGTVETISSVTGQVLLRGEPLPVEVKAYLDGEVVEVIEAEGVVVRSWGAFVQGIFGIGGETHGELKIVVADRDTRLTPELIDEASKDKVIVGGSFVTADAVKKAISVGAAGIVCGGFSDKDLRDFLGYDIGVAITGSEDLGVTLVVTEGFGEIMMAKKTFDLLRSNEGKMACINGATQIRAGVIRPEVIIPIPDDIRSGTAAKQSTDIGLEIGSYIRVIRAPYFGKIGKVTELPSPLQKLDSESMARVLKVKFEDGEEEVVIPRANVEMIEG
jgi:hypothetical protein